MCSFIRDSKLSLEHGKTECDISDVLISLW